MHEVGPFLNSTYIIIRHVYIAYFASVRTECFYKVRSKDRKLTALIILVLISEN